LRIYANTNWLQALGGLRQTAQVLDAAGKPTTPQQMVRSGQPGATHVDVGERWLKVSAAAQVAGVHPGVISRAVKSGILLSNNLKGSERRVCAIDFCRWILERSRHPERRESNEHVEALVRAHVRG
jgi:hypothetical protein